MAGASGRGTRVAVVGGGAVGLAAAWWLSRLGHAPVVLERGPLPNPEGSSWDRHRLIRLAHAPGDGRGRTIREAYAAWELLWGDLGGRHQRETGMVMTARAPGDWAHGARAAFDALGTPYEVWDRAELARRCPFLRLADGEWGLFTAEGGVLFADRIVRGLAGWLRGRGVELRPGCAALGVEGGPRPAVRLEGGGRLEADAVVVAAGAWAGGLVPGLAPRPEPRRAVVAYLEPPADLRAPWAGSPCFLDFGGESDGYLVPPMEGWGLKWGSGAHGRPGDPDAPREPRPGEPADLLALLAPHLSDLDRYRVADVRVCYTNHTPDERFLAGEAEPGLAFATGCSGQMFKFAAAMGRRVAEAAAGRLPGEALAAWARGDGGVPLRLAA